MQRSELTRMDYAGAERCESEPFAGPRCNARATVALRVVSRLTNPDFVLDRVYLLCADDADEIVASYEREWAKHPEMFES